MGEPVCDALEAELALDLIEAQLAVEMPPHVRAFARAHAEGRPPPASPLVGRLGAAMRAARNACMHEVLEDRGLALLRLVAPLVIEDDPVVAAARTQPVSWAGLAALASARDSVSNRVFGSSAVALMHRLHGVTVAAAPGRLEPPIEGWVVGGNPVDPERTWRTVAEQLAITSSCAVTFVRSSARARTFVVDRVREIIVVIPQALDTPAAHFTLLHELGHVAAAIVSPIGIARVLDEAIASLVARRLEETQPLAHLARQRRRALAERLDTIERGLPAIETPPPAPTLPWSLWHDPGAQAAYVEAEDIADRLATTREPFAEAVARERLAIG